MTNNLKKVVDFIVEIKNRNKEDFKQELSRVLIDSNIENNWLDIERFLPEINEKDKEEHGEAIKNVLVTNGDWVAISTLSDKWAWYHEQKAKGVVAWCEIKAVKHLKKK